MKTHNLLKSAGMVVLLFWLGSPAFPQTTSSGITGFAVLAPTAPGESPGKAGAPVAGATIQVYRSYGGPLVTAVNADDFGAFRIALEPGDYRLVPLPRDPSAPTPRGQQMDITVPFGRF